MADELDPMTWLLRAFNGAPVAFTHSVMNPDHPAWNQFLDVLEYRLMDQECTAHGDRPVAHSILQELEFSTGAISQSMKWFTRNGGFCDCEILMNCATNNLK